MKLRLGPVPDDPGFLPQEGGWVKVKEPSFGVLMLLALPLSVLVAWAVSLGWGAIAGLRGIEAGFSGVITPGTALLLLAGAAGVITAHELLHAIVLPGGGVGAATTLGFWPRALTPYVSYDGELSRNRHVLTAVTPLLGLSIAPLLLGLLLASVPAWAVAVSMLNGFGASGDLIGAALLLWQVPSSAVVRNKGRETWWRGPR